MVAGAQRWRILRSPANNLLVLRKYVQHPTIPFTVINSQWSGCTVLQHKAREIIQQTVSPLKQTLQEKGARRVQ